MLKSIHHVGLSKRLQVMLLGAALGLAFANLVALLMPALGATDTIGAFSGAALAGLFAKKLILVA